MPQLVWLITGCSSGFGEHFVSSILARGDKVIATARNLEKIKPLEQAGAATLQLDITDSQESIDHTITKAISVYGRIDVLINNASYVSIGVWEDLTFVPRTHFSCHTNDRPDTKISSPSSTRMSSGPSKSRARFSLTSDSDGAERTSSSARCLVGLDMRASARMPARSSRSRA